MTSIDLQAEVALLRLMKTGELLARYLEVFGQPSPSRHRERLVRRIAWKIQALAEGDLTERARRRAEEIANDADLRIHIPSTKTDDTGSRRPGDGRGSRAENLGSSATQPAESRDGHHKELSWPLTSGDRPGDRLRI